MRIRARNIPVGKPRSRALVPALLLGLAACGGDNDGTSRDGTQTDAGQVSELPAPEGAVGSVTGMPANPGPGTAPIIGADTGTDADAIDALAIESTFPLATPVPAGSVEPIDGVFVLTDAPPPPSAPQSPVDPTAGVAPPVPDSEPRYVTVGTEGATESTTIIVEPAVEDDD